MTTQIIMTKQVFEKNLKTRTTYLLISEESEVIGEKEYVATTLDTTCAYFRRLGGSEKKTYGYTCDGYRCVKLTSTSPDKVTKIVRAFNFKPILK